MNAVGDKFATRAGLVGVSPHGVGAALVLGALLLLYPLNMTPEIGDSFKYLLLPLLVLGGAVSAQWLGLRLYARSWRENVGVPLAASFVVGAAIMRFDATSLAATDFSSLLYYAPKAAAEELIYRLGATSCIALILSVATRQRASRAVYVLIAAIVAQSLNIVLNVHLAHQHLGYAAVRYLLPGVVWGWLYLRYGFLASVVGHVGTHLWLIPVLTYVR